MPPPDAELVRGTFEALHRRDHDEAARGFHQDAVWQNTSSFPGPRECIGRQAIVDFWTTMVEPFDEDAGTQVIEQLVAGENVVVVELRSTGRGRSSDVPIDIRWAAVVEVRDGAISRVRVHGDWAKALEGAGLAG
jgi:ketosteroid isomerase-like protein